MLREITGFDIDDEGDWRAQLSCRHYQHVRHNPPLVSRVWVTSEEGRAGKIGERLNCRKCDEAAPADF